MVEERTQSAEELGRESPSLIPAEPAGLRRRCWLIFLLTIAVFLIPSPMPPGHFLLTKSYAESWNDQARIATVESLVEHKTLAIDRTKWGVWTGDHAFLRDHFYATKPPLLSVMGAISYWILREVVQVTTGQKLTYIKNEDLIYPWVTLTTSVLAFALLLVYFYRALHLVSISPAARWWLFWALAVGSLYPAYSTVFNNHTVAGSCMFIAFYYVARYRLGGRLRWGEALFAGLAIGFAGVNDYTGALPFLVLLFLLVAWRDVQGAGLYAKMVSQKGAVLAWTATVLALGMMLLPRLGHRGVAVLLFGPVVIAALVSLILAVRHRPMTLLFLLGILLPVVAHLFFSSRITGNWLPTYVQTDVYIATPPGYFGEVISPEESGPLSPKRWIYIWTALFGIRGVFIYTPVLLIGLVAAVVAAFRRSDSLRWEAVAVVLTVLVGWGWVLLFGSPNFGGTSYGFRYSIPAAPLLIFFCYMIFRNGTAPILQTVFRNAVVWGMLIALIAIPGPWGMFSQALPKTDNSVVENLENIVAGLLFRGG